MQKVAVVFEDVKENSYLIWIVLIIFKILLKVVFECFWPVFSTVEFALGLIAILCGGFILGGELWLLSVITAVIGSIIGLKQGIPKEQKG